MNEMGSMAKVDAPNGIGVRTGIPGEAVGVTSVEVSVTTGVVSAPEMAVEEEVPEAVSVPFRMCSSTLVLSQVSI